ncbi:MAG: c-type cytochrome [Actinomycetota bacterium]|nr:c-type cytochrome [Actinomycetota bacterium]
MDTGQLLLVALAVLVPAALLWGIFLMRSGRTKKPSIMLGIPHAMRPAQPDEKLEGPRLERIMIFGLISTLAVAIFIPMYWLPESQRQASFTERFEEEAVERGELIFAVPPEIPEDADASAFRANERALALGQGCAQCHGASTGESGVDDPAQAAAGGQSNFADPETGKTVSYQAPPLQNVFQRWDEEVIKFTIERGRPGTDMAAWGVEYGGPMTDQMIDDVIAWMASLPGNQEAPQIPEDCANPKGDALVSCGGKIFEARCAVCHGPEGQGKEAKGIWYQGLALWKGDVKHLTKSQHLTTIKNGRRFAFMPAFAEAPAQGIPVPQYPLTEAQIEAVVAYERTL